MQRYTVPVILQDLPATEALYQAFDSLYTLSEAVNDAFGRITARIAAERTKVQNVNSRVAAAQQKIERIAQNQTKVTTIHSPAKFPAPKQLPDFRRVWDETEEHPLKHPKRTEYPLTYKQRTQEQPPSDTAELFSAFAKQRATRQDVDRRGEAEALTEGLGRLPPYLPSVSSILLFNSDENPYKKYVSFNNLEGTGGEDRVEQQRELAEAPKTIFEGTGLPTFQAMAYEYKPDLGQVPTFALPANLPLGRLADISFGVSEQVTSIAPSVAHLPQLPSIDAFRAMPAPAREKAKGGLVTGSSAPPMAPAAPPPEAPADASFGAPSPPPPPPPDAPPMAPPPPAPPMAPPMDAPPIAPASALTAGAGPGPGPAESSGGGDDTGGGDARSDLMAAIRNRSNQARLRQVKRDQDGNPLDDGDRPVTTAPKKKPAAEPMDMMAALKERLARRHTVMSGKVDYSAQSKPAAGVGAGGEESAPRLSLPRLNKPGEGKRAFPGPKKIEEGDESQQGGDAVPANVGLIKSLPRMADVVIAAKLASHQAEQAAGDDGWEDD